jgi:hypothetical protein
VIGGEITTRARVVSLEDYAVYRPKSPGLVPLGRHGNQAAAFRFTAPERSCKQALALRARGMEPILVPKDRAGYSHEYVGSQYIGWLQFRTLYQQLVAIRSDMFS